MGFFAFVIVVIIIWVLYQAYKIMNRANDIEIDRHIGILESQSNITSNPHKAASILANTVKFLPGTRIVDKQSEILVLEIAGQLQPIYIPNFIEALKHFDLKINTPMYKKVWKLYDEVFEPIFMDELDQLRPEDVSPWIKEKKDFGHYLTDKVYARAMHIKQRKKWLSDEDYQKENPN